jgi:hypothetical protein
MSRSFALALLLALPAIHVAAPAAARAAQQPVKAVLDPQGKLSIGGVQILDLADKSVNPTMLNRSNQIYSRLVEALWKIHKKHQYAAVEVSVVHALSVNGKPDATAAKEPWILIQGVPVMKVTNEDARATGKTPAVLAEHYAGCFRSALRRVYTP